MYVPLPTWLYMYVLTRDVLMYVPSPTWLYMYVLTRMCLHWCIRVSSCRFCRFSAAIYNTEHILNREHILFLSLSLSSCRFSAAIYNTEHILNKEHILSRARALSLFSCRFSATLFTWAIIVASAVVTPEGSIRHELSIVLSIERLLLLSLQHFL